MVPQGQFHYFFSINGYALVNERTPAVIIDPLVQESIQEVVNRENNYGNYKIT